MTASEDPADTVGRISVPSVFLRFGCSVRPPERRLILQTAYGEFAQVDNSGRRRIRQMFRRENRRPNRSLKIIASLSMSTVRHLARFAPASSNSTMNRPSCQYAALMVAFTERTVQRLAAPMRPATSLTTDWNRSSIAEGLSIDAAMALPYRDLEPRVGGSSLETTGPSRVLDRFLEFGCVRADCRYVEPEAIGTIFGDETFVRCEQDPPCMASRATGPAYFRVVLMRPHSRNNPYRFPQSSNCAVRISDNRAGCCSDETGEQPIKQVATQSPQSSRTLGHCAYVGTAVPVPLRPAACPAVCRGAGGPCRVSPVSWVRIPNPCSERSEFRASAPAVSRRGFSLR